MRAFRRAGIGRDDARRLRRRRDFGLGFDPVAALPGFMALDDTRSGACLGACLGATLFCGSGFLCLGSSLPCADNSVVTAARSRAAFAKIGNDTVAIPSIPTATNFKVSPLAMAIFPFMDGPTPTGGIGHSTNSPSAAVLATSRAGA
jgi:hypothetical protein